MLQREIVDGIINGLPTNRRAVIDEEITYSDLIERVPHLSKFSAHTDSYMHSAWNCRALHWSVSRVVEQVVDMSVPEVVAAGCEHTGCEDSLKTGSGGELVNKLRTSRCNTSSTQWR